MRKLLREDAVRPEWFTSHVHEVQHGPVRLVLRRSEAVRRKAHRRRHDKLAKLHALITARNAFVRKAPRTRAHVFVTMLALKVVREMRRALVAAFGTTDDNKMAVTVDDALAALSRLCLLRYQVRGTAITRLPAPDVRQAAILNALGTPLPCSRSLHIM